MTSEWSLTIGYNF